MTDKPPGLRDAAPPTSRGAVFWVAIAIFAQESVWNFYDAQVPASLRQYLSSAGLIGLIMGMDNVLGVIVQPWMGNFSDRRAHARTGRWPIILIGACVAAVPFALIPWSTSLPSLMACVFCFALVANGFKGVTETLVSDYVAPENRSKAQGFVKAGVSLTIVVSSLISLLVVDRSLKAAFVIPPVLMLVMVGLAAWFLGRRHTYAVRATSLGPAGQVHEFSSLRVVIRDLVRDRSRTGVLLMLGIFCFAGMWSALRSLLTPYATEVLGLSRGAAGGLALPSAIVFLAAVMPIAYVSERVGQIRMIRYGAALFTLGLLAGFTVPTTAMTMASTILSSVGYAAFAVNGLVALWNLAPSDRVLGTYTGLYTVASASGMALGPALLGAAVDGTGWRFMLLNAAAFSGVTFVVLTWLAKRASPSTRTGS
ncbi:MFS transporter [Sphaerisporangium viridialbum]|uniref:MFS transporter n=1 Tax=Sphaerisporangium viridialbum TaxID=46189 RepID=UPI003C7658E0